MWGEGWRAVGREGMYSSGGRGGMDEGVCDKQRAVGYMRTIPLSSPCLFSTFIHAIT